MPWENQIRDLRGVRIIQDNKCGKSSQHNVACIMIVTNIRRKRRKRRKRKRRRRRRRRKMKREIKRRENVEVKSMMTKEISLFADCQRVGG